LLWQSELSLKKRKLGIIDDAGVDVVLRVIPAF
jgi:hypothetical protein